MYGVHCIVIKLTHNVALIELRCPAQSIDIGFDEIEAQLLVILQVQENKVFQGAEALVVLNGITRFREVNNTVGQLDDEIRQMIACHALGSEKLITVVIKVAIVEVTGDHVADVHL